MNYILQLEVKHKIMRDGLKRLREYADSSKFNYPDNHMNVEDLRLRLREIETDLDFFEDHVQFCPNYDCKKHGQPTAFNQCGKCGTETELLIEQNNSPQA
jgi:hypothetical protein